MRLPLRNLLSYFAPSYLAPSYLATALLLAAGCTPRAAPDATDASPPARRDPAPAAARDGGVPVDSVVIREASRDSARIVPADSFRNRDAPGDGGADATPLPYHPDVRRGTLANGLTYYVLENERPGDRAELRLAVRAGSVLEDEDQRGLAHFVEHMAFNGTANYPENELIDYLQSTGARFGPDLNAYTSFDETVYLLQVRTDSAEMLDEGLGILRDWAGEIAFDPAEIDRERGVVLGEWRSGLGAQERMRDETLPVTYANSRYAERLPIGDTAVLKRAPYEALTRFYEDWYRPELMAVIVVGDVDADAVEEQVRRRFGDLTNPGEPRERTEYPGPRYDATDVAIAQDPEAQFSLLRVDYLLPESTTATERDFRDELVAGLYARMLGARFAERREDPEAPFSFANSGRGGMVGDVDRYGSFAVVKPGRATEALTELVAENRRVLAYGFTAGELARAKASVLNAYRQAVQEAATTPSRQLASGLVSSFLEEEPLLSPRQELDRVERYLDGIRLPEVDELARTYLAERPRAVVLTGNTAEDFPTEDELLAALRAADAAEVAPYEDAPVEAYEIPALPPVAVASTVRFDSADVTVVTLANGVRVAYKVTDFTDDEILFSGVSKGGSNLFADEDYPSADLVNAVGGAMGIGPLTPTALRKALAGKTVGLSASVGADTERLRGQATPATLGDLMELVYLHFAGSAYDEDLARAVVEQQRSFIANLASNPNFQFQAELNEILYGNDDPRHRLPSPQLLDAVDTRRAFGLYRERFADARDWQFNFVGDLDPDTLLDYARRYLGNLPSGELTTADAYRDPGDEMARGDVDRRFEAGAAPKSQALILKAGPFEDSERERIVFGVMRDVLGEELRERLREELGGVYGVRVSAGNDVRPRPEYQVSVSFNAEPERVDELLAAVEEVVGRIIAEGPLEKTLPAIRETQYQGMRQAMRNSNGFWLPVMERAYTLERNINNADAERLRGLLADVTAADVQRALRQYWADAAETEVALVMDPAEG